MTRLYLNILNYLGVFSIFILVQMNLAMQSAWAHPVAFTGSTSIMFESDPGRRDLQLFYSHRYWIASGVSYTNLTLPSDEAINELDILTPQLNLLARRWNRPESQTNLYLLAGYGAANSSLTDRVNAAGRVGLQFDSETRRLYTLFKYERLTISQGVEIDSFVLRGGLAPFLGNFDELNIWFIIETKYAEEFSKQPSITPMLRFYLKNVLWEVGSSLKGDSYFSFMVHL